MLKLSVRQQNRKKCWVFMKNSGLDRRIKYTKKTIRHSFLSLLFDKPMGKITVKEICELADINRTTFYSHYNDVYDLMDKIEEEFYREVQDSVRYMITEDFTGIMPIEILKKFRENEELCRVMFGKYGDKEFIRKMMYFAEEDSLEDWKKLYPDLTEEKLEWLYGFIVNGCAGIIQKWVESGFRAEPEEMAQFMAQMFRCCVKALGR